MFPSLTNLTYLRIRAGRGDILVHDGVLKVIISKIACLVLFQTLEKYGSTLEIFRTEVHLGDFSALLPLLPNLRTLEIEEWTPMTEMNHRLFEALMVAKHIKNLMVTRRLWKEWHPERSSRLTHLESLYLYDFDFEYVLCDSFDFSEFKNLTELGILVECRNPLSLLCTTTLRELHCYSYDASEETIQKLALLPNLRRVYIELGCKIPSFVFKNWKELRCLSILLFDVDDDFFPTLAKLPNLEHLEFREDHEEEEMLKEEFRSTICLLTSLRTLIFRSLNVNPLTFIPEGSFPSLKIFIANCDLSVDTKNELFRRLPCLLKAGDRREYQMRFLDNLDF